MVRGDLLWGLAQPDHPEERPMIEEPVGFNDEGKLVTAYRMTEADKADIFMANEMYMASPEAKDQMQALWDSLPSGSVTISGYFDTD